MSEEGTTCEIRTKRNGKDFVMTSDNKETCDKLMSKFGADPNARIKTNKKKSS